jgi:hypothetical protein
MSDEKQPQTGQQVEQKAEGEAVASQAQGPQQEPSAEAQRAEKARPRRAPYDIWAISLAAFALLCDVLGSPNLGLPPGAVAALSMGAWAGAFAAFITGIVGLFSFRVSRWLAVVGLLASGRTVITFVIQQLR